MGLAADEDCLVQSINVWETLRAMLAAEVMEELSDGRLKALSSFPRFS